MNLYSDRTLRRLLLPGLVLASVQLGSVAALAQEPDAGSAALPATVVQQATGPIEEVIVTGRRSYNSLLNEAARETEDFYMRLNEVLDNDDFRIRCRTETPPGTSIATRVCRTGYQEEFQSRQALSIIQGPEVDSAGELAFFGSIYDSYPDIYRMHLQFEEQMLMAVNSDPQLNASVRRLLQLKSAVQNYETPAQLRRREAREARESAE